MYGGSEVLKCCFVLKFTSKSQSECILNVSSHSVLNHCEMIMQAQHLHPLLERSFCDNFEYSASGPPKVYSGHVAKSITHGRQKPLKRGVTRVGKFGTTNVYSTKILKN